MVAPRAEIDAAGDAPVFISTILLGELAFGVLAAAIEQTGCSPRPHYNDLWIASQAIEHGYALMTLNVPDFADLLGLSVIVSTSADTS
ncbi:VapC toxin family PIN domain ribonuclease [Burkholderia cenocepacia]|nr:VapC toxin family PIN domain ribonuclease [Burkholderia cenocepacia]MBR8093752.1 VapC toxin family PIN domain ribonuclease [Burkholderia cenocepacia]